MFPALKTRFESLKEKWNNLTTQQQYIRIGVTASIATATVVSLYIKKRKRRHHQQYVLSLEPAVSPYFSKTYNESRQKFRDACANIPNCKTHSIKIDPFDDLTIDMCYIPPTATDIGDDNDHKNNIKTSDANHLFIHMSGVHGAEGYAGAAIQCKLLTQYTSDANTRSDVRFDPSVHYLFIHAINPFGMKHGRRFNQFNVDLNRNGFLSAQKWREMKARPETLVGYHIIDPYINPGSVPFYPWSDIKHFFNVLKLLCMDFGFRLPMLGRALVTGQYHKGIGAFYGGYQLQKELRSVVQFILCDCEDVWRINLRDMLFTRIRMDDNTAKVRERARDRHQLTVVDVHTGLGPRGRDTLLANRKLFLDKCQRVLGKAYAKKGRMQTPEQSENLSINEMYRYSDGAFSKCLARAMLRPDRFLMENYETDDEDEGKYEVNDVNRFKSRPLRFDKSALDLIAITQEFGTYSSTAVGTAIILENIAFQNCKSAEFAAVLKRRQKNLRDIFYIEDDNEWKYNVINHGVHVFNRLCTR